MRSPSNLISTKELDSPLDQLSAAAVRYRIAVGPPLAFELENEVDLVDGYRRAAAEEFPRTIDHDITRSIYGFDPDGNAVEIYADMTREWRTERTGVVTKPTPQWTPREPPPRAERLYHESPEIRRVEGAILHPTRITHVVLVARDYEAMIEYYRDRIGLRLLHRGVRTAFAVLGGTSGSRDLYLFRMREGWPVGLHHVGSLARDEADLAASASSLARAGLALERDIDHASRRCIHIKDPDGLRLQFYIDRGDPLGALDGLDVDTALFLA